MTRLVGIIPQQGQRNDSDEVPSGLRIGNALPRRRTLALIDLLPRGAATVASFDGPWKLLQSLRDRPFPSYPPEPVPSRSSVRKMSQSFWDWREYSISSRFPWRLRTKRRTVGGHNCDRDHLL